MTEEQKTLPFTEEQNAKRRQGGKATSGAILSAHLGGNADLFPKILSLHVPKGAKVADITWGKGVFWQQVPKGDYEVLATDISNGVDCRELPYVDASLDCVVFDPPYMEGLFRRSETHMAGSGTHAAFRKHYSNGQATDEGGPKWHGAVIDLYVKTGHEVSRILKPDGIFIVKCQDEVSANRQWLTHIEIVNAYAGMGFYARDLFVVIRTNRPVVTRLKRQVHARKNHSYFLVFQKTDGKRKSVSAPGNIKASPQTSTNGVVPSE